MSSSIFLSARFNTLFSNPAIRSLPNPKQKAMIDGAYGPDKKGKKFVKSDESAHANARPTNSPVNKKAAAWRSVLPLLADSAIEHPAIEEITTNITSAPTGPNMPIKSAIRPTYAVAVPAAVVVVNGSMSFVRF